VQPAICPLPLRAAAFLADSLGGLPRWLLRDAGAEAKQCIWQSVDAAEESSALAAPSSNLHIETSANSVEAVRNDVELNEDQVAALRLRLRRGQARRNLGSGRSPMPIVAAPNLTKKNQKTNGRSGRHIVAGVSELSEEEAEEVEAGRAAKPGRNSPRMSLKNTPSTRRPWRARA